MFTLVFNLLFWRKRGYNLHTTFRFKGKVTGLVGDEKFSTLLDRKSLLTNDNCTRSLCNNTNVKGLNFLVYSYP